MCLFSSNFLRMIWTVLCDAWLFCKSSISTEDSTLFPILIKDSAVQVLRELNSVEAMASSTTSSFWSGCSFNFLTFRFYSFSVMEDTDKKQDIRQCCQSDKTEKQRWQIEPAWLSFSVKWRVNVSEIGEVDTEQPLFDQPSWCRSVWGFQVENMKGFCINGTEIAAPEYFGSSDWRWLQWPAATSAL